MNFVKVVVPIDRLAIKPEHPELVGIDISLSFDSQPLHVQIIKPEDGDYI